MDHRLSRAALIGLLAAAPAARAQAPQATAPPLDELVRRAAEKLAAQGLSVDLERLAVAVLPLAEREAAERARLEAEFGSQRAGAYRLLLQGAGLRFVDGGALLADWARGRAEDRAACYFPEARQLVVAAEQVEELDERELLGALAQAARHQSGAPAFEASAGETLDGWVARAALTSGGALAEVRRALRTSVVDQDLRWGRELDLPRLERELARRGLDSFEAVSSPEARAAEWAGAYASTEQLLHRDKRGQDAPVGVSLPPWPEELPGAQLLHEDTIGELALFALLLELGSTRPRAEVAAAGWDGDRLRHYRTAEGEDVLVWRTLWDRPADAQQFADEWELRAKGQIRRGGRGVDWVLAGSKGVWNKLLKSLDASPQRVTPNEADAKSTEKVEQGDQERRRSAPYVVANEWRHPRLDMTVVVPIGWYEDERDGTAFIVRTKTAGYRDNVQVVAGAPDGQTIDEILALNEERLRSEGEHEFISAEKRMLGATEVGLLRYRSRQGAHEVVFSTLVVLRGWRQVGVTIGIEASRWGELQAIVEEILTNVRLEPVEPMH